MRKKSFEATVAERGGKKLSRSGAARRLHAMS